MPSENGSTADDLRGLTRRWFQELWNRRREETLDELCAEDFRADLEGVREPVGKEDFRHHFHVLTGAISDLQVHVLDTSVEEPKVAVAWHLTGTHTGEELGIPPSGRRVSIHGMSWMEWRGPRLVRCQNRWNRGEMIASLMRVRTDELTRRFGLTPRQTQVALLLAERRTYKEIARSLDIRPNTARRHSAMVLRKLGVNRREDVSAIIGNGRGRRLRES